MCSSRSISAFTYCRLKTKLSPLIRRLSSSPLISVGSGKNSSRPIEGCLQTSNLKYRRNISSSYSSTKFVALILSEPQVTGLTMGDLCQGLREHPDRGLCNVPLRVLVELLVKNLNLQNAIKSPRGLFDDYNHELSSPEVGHGAPTRL